MYPVAHVLLKCLQITDYRLVVKYKQVLCEQWGSNPQPYTFVNPITCTKDKFTRLPNIFSFQFSFIYFLMQKTTSKLFCQYDCLKQ